jgi:hypothetical protein
MAFCGAVYKATLSSFRSRLIGGSLRIDFEKVRIFGEW